MKKRLLQIAAGISALVLTGLVAQTVRDLSASEKLWHPITDNIE